MLGSVKHETAATEQSEALLMLIGEFVDAVISEAMMGMVLQAEFREMIRPLCEKAPEATRSLATTVLEYSNADGRAGATTINPQGKVSDLNNRRRKKLKCGRHEDTTYRAPKSAQLGPAASRSDPRTTQVAEPSLGRFNEEPRRNPSELQDNAPSTAGRLAGLDVVKVNGRVDNARTEATEELALKRTNLDAKGHLTEVEVANAYH
ncbi:hypothetical protein LTS18_004447 [Coniosporium uncinatum]|uniref:Uncharacterized protein n=1 Tax=Coniosporium uncinatum TaxID=93489 RepID=A0ACC3DY37_9PEZI|nr:hypothetical protein LTS18_004447 [Coniosporium uncinatum]